MSLDSSHMTRMVKLIFEAAMLKRTCRTGYAFLGSGQENVAAHSFSTAFIAMLLGRMVPEADMERLVQMAVLHDLPEARTGDANGVHKLYVTRDEKSAFRDAVDGSMFARDMLDLYRDFEEGASLEAKLVRDADQLDMLISLKEQADCGNPNAASWVPFVKERLITSEAKMLAQRIDDVHWASWWMESFTEIHGKDQMEDKKEE